MATAGQMNICVDTAKGKKTEENKVKVESKKEKLKRISGLEIGNLENDY